MGFCTLQIEIISTYSPTHIRKQYSKHTAKKAKNNYNLDNDLVCYKFPLTGEKKKK